MLARAGLVAAAVAAIVVLGVRLRDHDRCDGARSALVAGGGDVRALLGSCRDPDVVAGVSAALLASGRAGDGLRLARAAVARAPDSFIGWVAMAVALRPRDAAAARRAERRARALNPRWPGLAGP